MAAPAVPVFLMVVFTEKSELGPPLIRQSGIFLGEGYVACARRICLLITGLTRGLGECGEDRLSGGGVLRSRDAPGVGAQVGVEDAVTTHRS